MAKEDLSLMSNDNLKKKLILIQLILLILASGSVLHIFFGEILTFFFIFFLIGLYYITRPMILNKGLVKSFLLSESFFLFFLVFNFFVVRYENSIASYLSLFFRITIVNIFVFYLINFRINFLEYLYRALIIIIILSGFNFFLSFFIIPYATVTSNSLSLKTVFYVFNYQSEFVQFGLNFYRNQSFFWEPGILSIYMNLFVLTSFFLNRFNIWLYIAFFIILTTFSTTGFFLLLIQLTYYYFKKKSNFSVKIIGVFFLFFLVSFFLIPNLLEKTSGSGVASFDLRGFDLLNAISIFINNPNWGIGIDQNVYLSLYDKYQIFDAIDFTYDVYSDVRGNTNSILMIFVNFGIFCGLAFYYFFFNKKIFGHYSVLFYMIIIVSLQSEPLMLSNFFLMIPLFSFYKFQTSK